MRAVTSISLPFLPSMIPAQARKQRSAVVALSLLLILSALVIYWWSLRADHQQMRAETIRQAETRTTQSADAVAQQMVLLLRNIDYILRTLAREYHWQTTTGFDRLAQGVISDYPPGAIIQIAVADAAGDIRYSNLGLTAGQAPASIADREHFRVHLDAATPRLYIGKPVKGRVSGQWSIQLSYPLIKAGRCDGVIVLSLAPAHIAALLGQLAAHPEDTAFLMRDDGHYLARSNDLEKALGTMLPLNRPFLQAGAAPQGNYTLSGQIDGTHRFYGWRKLPEFGLNLVIGLASAPILAPVEASIRENNLRSAVGSGLLVLAWFWIVFLFWRLGRQEQNLHTVFETLPVGVMIVDPRGNVTGCNTQARELLSDGQDCRPNLDTPQLTSRLTRKDGTPVLPTEALAKPAWADQEAITGLTLGLHPNGDDDRQLRWLSVNATPQESGYRHGAIVVLTDITQQMASAQFRRALLDNSAIAIAIAGPGRQVAYINRQISQLLGYDSDELVGHSFRKIHLDDAHFHAFEPYYAKLLQDTQLETEYPFRHKDGSIRWCTIHATLLSQPHKATQIVWSLLDNTARHYAQEALEMTKQRLEVVIDRFPAGVLVADPTGRITHSNQALAELFGAQFTPQKLLERTLGEALAVAAPQFETRLRSDESSQTLSLRDGRILTYEAIPISHGDAPRGHLLIWQDITEYKQREQLLERLATTDTLTELPNRRSFIQHCEDELKRWHRHGGERGALVMFDLDHFKRVNDTWGHAVGDQVLVQVAAITRQLLRTTDTAGRVGGEEFMILLPNTSLDGARQLAERLRQGIESTPTQAAHGPLGITASLGITLFPAHGEDSLPQAMLRADQALYAAKAAGRNRVCECCRSDGLPVDLYGVDLPA